MDNKPISQAWLDKMNGKDTFVQRLFTVFVTEEPKRMETIRAALEDRDTAQMAYLTHSLKGAAATMGAEGLRQCALELELAGKAGNLEESRACFDRLHREIERVYVFMREFLERMQGNF